MHQTFLDTEIGNNLQQVVSSAGEAIAANARVLKRFVSGLSTGRKTHDT